MAVTPASALPAAPPERLAPDAPAQAAKGVTAFAEADGPSFWDVLDVINPLQHIPIVNTLYREITGDQIGAVSKLAGGTLFGGVFGLGAALVNLAVEDGTGKDISEHAVALFRDDDAPTAVAAAETPVAVASAEPPRQSVDLQALAKEEPAPAAPARIPGPIATPGLLTMAQEPSPTPATTTAAAMPLRPAAEPKFMPIPGRSAPTRTPNPAALISSSGRRAAGNLPDPESVKRAMGLQGIDGAHPMLPGTETASPLGAVAPASGNDWFAANVMQAMDKYKQGAKLGAAAQPTP